MTAPEISVIIPACAAEATLPRAVSSVLASRDVSVEAIVVANDEADYETALRLRPDSVELLTNYGNLVRDLGDAETVLGW